jgi:hypothetical protein
MQISPFYAISEGHQSSFRLINEQAAVPVEYRARQFAAGHTSFNCISYE